MSFRSLIPAILLICATLPARAGVIDVRPGSKITDAVAASAPGDTVRVHAGRYAEPTIEVDRPLVLIGVGWPILDGEGKHQILHVTGDDVTVSGFLLRNVGVSFMEDRAAIKVEDAFRCVVSGNRFEENFFAIYLAKTVGCEVKGNAISAINLRETNSGNGIHVWYSRDVAISNNVISGHRDGIYLEFVEHAEVTNNTATGNLRYGLHFMFSDDCTYSDNRFADNGAGVAVMYSDRVTILRNTFDDNWGAAAYGLLLKELKGSTVNANTFSGNSVALFVDGTDRTQFDGNTFERNGWAVKIMANATDNAFVGNTFTGNTFDVSTNSRTVNSTFDQNRWDRYRGYDLDRDGIGDVPFRPVRLFSLLVERNETALVLLHSVLVDVLDTAERVLPVLTPNALVDHRPLMQ